MGSAAIQIAKVLGARVIATAGSVEKLARAQALGADDVVSHAGRSFAREVRRLTNKKGADVVFEHVGEVTWEESIKSLATGGRLVTCGATTGFEGQIDLRVLFSRQLSILGSYMGSKAEMIPVLEHFERGLLKPVIDCVLPLEQAARAHERLERGEQFGKIVLEGGLVAENCNFVNLSAGEKAMVLMDHKASAPRPEGKPGRGFRIYLLVSSTLILIAAIYSGMVFYSRYEENIAAQQQAAEKKRVRRSAHARHDGRQHVRHSHVLRESGACQSRRNGAALLWRGKRQIREP